MPAVSGPYEALGHDRIALIVDLEASAVHEPGPGAFDDPAFGQRFELAGVDAVHHFDTDVMVAAVLDEGAREAGVAPELGEASEGFTSPVRYGDSADVVRDARRHDDHRHEEPQGVDDAEGLAAVDLLPLCRP